MAGRAGSLLLPWQTSRALTSSLSSLRAAATGEATPSEANAALDGAKFISLRRENATVRARAPCRDDDCCVADSAAELMATPLEASPLAEAATPPHVSLEERVDATLRCIELEEKDTHPYGKFVYILERRGGGPGGNHTGARRRHHVARAD